MRLPININDMLTARVIEWEQLEFKAGWDYVKVMKTMCAFSYDFNKVPHHIEWVNHFWYGRFSFNVPLIINC